ncbi:uncharacterized protein [Apostichopus japonicus]|uniref:uncharacterized protein isoform X3 n=1 Tax=Stichopus japonicus TaxID=307972 RepID=UPI003AB50371
MGNTILKKLTFSITRRKALKAFTKDLKVLREWLKGAIEFTQAWRAPEHNIVNIRTQLERHLAFALEVKTHQYQLENILFTGRNFLDAFPQLGEVLEDTLADIETEWNCLDSHLGIQSKQIQEALAVVETSIGSSTLQDADIEQIQDTLDHMNLRLTCNQDRLPQVQETLNSVRVDTQTVLSSSVTGPLPCSSSPDFEALYSDLNDWLDDMQLAVTDSDDVFISEPQMEQMCQGYEQELQLREVSRSKLQRKGLQLMSSNPNLAEQVRNRLESLNQRWKVLQSKLLMPIKPKNSKKRTDSSSSSIFTTSEEALSVVLEVEDVISRLKVWLTRMEQQLFSSQGSLEHLNEEQLENKKTELEGLQAEIKKHAPGIEMVLSLCDLLLADGSTSTLQKDQDNLRLTSFNLDRRWQAVQAQSRDLFARLEKKMEEARQQNATEEVQLSDMFTPSKYSTSAWSMTPHRYHPTPSIDDDAVDGFTFRVNDLQRRLDIEELVIAREAFSENDAYSISDTSDVSLGDLDFDDVLPLKDGEDNHDIDPGPGTPDIMDFAEDILDKYLEMESSILHSSTGVAVSEGRPLPDPAESSKREVEFWTMSPKEGGTFNFDQTVLAGRSIPKPSFSPFQSEALNQSEQEESIDDEEQGSVIVEVSDLELDERELLEGALWDLCLSSDEGEGDEDVSMMNPPSPEEAAEAIFQAFNFPSVIDDSEDVFKHSDPIPLVEPVSHMDNSHVRAILCQSWPMKTSSFLVSEKSPSIENLTTPSICPDIDRFFPSFLGEELSFKETKRGLDSLRLNLNLSPSKDHSSRQSKEDLEETEDALLEITDLSLSHMYESLDFMTELTSRLATDSLSTSPSSSEDYFSCQSLDDIDTASIFNPSIIIKAGTDSGCYLSKQETTVGDLESLFPAMIESKAINARVGEETISAKQEMYDYSSDEQWSHVVSDTVQCVNTDDTHSVGSECQDYFDALFGSDLTESLGTDMSVNCEDNFRMSSAVERESSMGEGRLVMQATEEVPCTYVNGSEELQDAKQGCMSCEDNVTMSSAVERESSMGEGRLVTQAKQATEEVPCTFVNGSEELQVAKQGYMSYVAQLSDSCRDGDLMNYLDSVKLKKCYLWSMAGSNVDKPADKDSETGDMEQELDELLLKPEELEKKWELDSEGSDDTDKLIEASSSLINELNRRDLAGSPGPDASTGDWKDVIVLWLDKNTKDAAQEADLKEIQSAGTEVSNPNCDEVDFARRRVEETDGRNGQIGEIKYSDELVNIHVKPSFMKKVLMTALPIQLLLYLYIILVLVLPCVVETSTGDCYLSLSDNLLIDSHRLGPIVTFIRGPPPV